MPQESCSHLRRSLSPFPHPAHPSLIPHRERRQLPRDLVPLHEMVLPMSGLSAINQFQVSRAVTEGGTVFVSLDDPSLAFESMTRYQTETSPTAVIEPHRIVQDQVTAPSFDAMRERPSKGVRSRPNMATQASYPRPTSAQSNDALSPVSGGGLPITRETDDSLEHTARQNSLLQLPPSALPRTDRLAEQLEAVVELPSGVRRFQRKMRDVDAYIVWYLSEGPDPLPITYPSAAANLGDLFIHRRAHHEDALIWVFGKSGTWEEIDIGGKHPLLSGYRLHLLASGDPGWVTRKTATTYRGRQKRQANAVSNTF